MNRSITSITFAALSAAVLGCGAGGTNDVSQTGTRGEDPGPKGTPTLVGGTSAPTGQVGTITALCIQACSHLRAANCDHQPAHTASECSSECAGSSGALDCDDELVRFYNCVLNNPVECSSLGRPEQEACEPLSTAYEDCLDHGGGEKYPGCVAVPAQDSTCSYYGPSSYKYYQCTSASSPAPACVYVYSNAFCCP